MAHKSAPLGFAEEWWHPGADDMGHWWSTSLASVAFEGFRKGLYKLI